jgi:hypothetical protein
LALQPDRLDYAIVDAAAGNTAAVDYTSMAVVVFDVEIFFLVDYIPD